MERRLATIRQIASLHPIPGADAIEAAKVDGWEVVVRKDEGYRPGDKVVYFEIDSVLPERSEFEFLRARRFRLRTIKLRGQLSQGLVMPLSILPKDTTPNLGDDVTELLGITKYERPIPVQLQGQVKGNFPGFLRKTDQERCQNLVKEITELAELGCYTFEVTEKLDGTSFTAYLRNGEFGVCSRNMELKLEDEQNLYIRIARRYDLEALLRAHGRNIALQGEIIGEGIQGNPLGLKGQQLRLFDVFDIDQYRYLAPEDRKATLTWIYSGSGQDWRKLHVPWRAAILLQSTSVEQLLQDWDGISSWIDQSRTVYPPAEGVVFRANTYRYQGDIFSFKVISNSYLLGEKG